MGCLELFGSSIASVLLLVVIFVVYLNYRFCSILGKKINQKDPMDFEYMEDDANLQNAIVHRI